MRFALTMPVLLAACGVGERRLPIEDWDQLPACVRRSALFAFDTLGAPGSSWWSPDPEIEAEAARDVKGASPAQFVEALQHRDRHVRYGAVWAAGMLGPDAQSLLPALFEACNDKSLHVQCAASVSLGRIGPAALAELIAALRRGEPLSWAHMNFAFVSMDRPTAILATKALVPLLSVDDVALRQRTIYALRALREGAREAVPELLRILESGEPRCRNAAAWCLASVGPRDARIISPLVSALEHAITEQGARHALQGVGEPARPALIATLQSDSRRGRLNAARVLATFEDSGPALPVLLRALEGSNADDAKSALSGLGCMGSKAEPAIPKLIALLGHRQLGQRASWTLGAIGAPAVPALTDACWTLDSTRRAQAWQALKRAVRRALS